MKTKSKDELLRKMRGEPLTEYETLALARALEVSLDEKDGRVVAEPAELTPELRRGIEANEEDLVKVLLFRRVGVWATRKEREGFVFAPPSSADEALNEAWYGDLEGFRKALRAWARSGLRVA